MRGVATDEEKGGTKSLIAKALKTWEIIPFSSFRLILLTQRSFLSIWEISRNVLNTSDLFVALLVSTTKFLAHQYRYVLEC